MFLVLFYVLEPPGEATAFGNSITKRGVRQTLDTLGDTMCKSNMHRNAENPCECFTSRTLM